MSKLLIKAKELEDEGNLKVSLTYYEMVLGDKSCPYDIRCDMGRVLNKLGAFKEALKCFDIVLTMNENHIYSLFGKGIASLRLNNWDVALDSFLKAIKIDNANANFYYYVSIILQSNGNEKANEYYSKFRELDNEEFKQIRSNYDFGLIFLNAKSELSNEKQINLKAFEDKLKSFNLSDDEIEYRSQFLEMGLDDDDVDDLFLIESVDYLKNDIISRTNNNPFPDKVEMIEIPLYVEDVDSESFNVDYIFNELVINDDNFNEDLKQSKEIEKNKLIYKHVRKAIIEHNDFILAKIYIDLIDETMIYDKPFRVNFIYLRGLVLANLNLVLDKVLKDFSSIEQEFPEIINDKNYIHNKNKIEELIK